jgi:hypothetical protein
MRLEDFEVRLPSAQDGQRLRFLWARYLLGEAQKKAWILWVKVGCSIVIAFATVASVWMTSHGGIK